MSQCLTVVALLSLMCIAVLVILAARRAGSRTHVALGLMALVVAVLVFGLYREYVERDLFRIMASDTATIVLLDDDGPAIQVETEVLMAGVTGAIIYDRLDLAASGNRRLCISFHSNSRTVASMDIVTVPQHAGPAHVYQRLHDAPVVARIRGRFYQFSQRFYDNLEAILGPNAGDAP